MSAKTHILVVSAGVTCNGNPNPPFSVGFALIQSRKPETIINQIAVDKCN